MSDGRPKFFTLSRSYFSHYSSLVSEENRRKERNQKMLWRDFHHPLWLVLERAVESKEALYRYHGLLSDARTLAGTHARPGPQVRDGGMCLKWCSPAGAVRTPGTRQKHELGRDQRSEVTFLLSCEISRLDIDTHTHTRALESTSSYCLKTAQSWTGADGMWGFKELHV